MAMTRNFDKESEDGRREDKVIVRVSPAQNIGTDTPGLKPAKNGAYMWILNSRRRSGKSWREGSSIN